MLFRHGRRTLTLHHAAMFRPLRPTRRCLLTTMIPTEKSARHFSTQQDARPVARRKSFDSGPGFNSGRNLATAIDDQLPSQQTTYDHLQSSGLSPFSENSSDERLYHVRAFDASSALTLDDRDFGVYPRARMLHAGIPGAVDEMLSVLDACCLVGKVERAELILLRLASVEGFPPEQLILRHNQFLRASIEHSRLREDRSQIEHLHGWYESKIRRARLPQTAETIACMLKATLMSGLPSAKRDRLLKRYMAMAPGEAGLDVLSMAEILNDQDLAEITNACPIYNLAPVEETEAVGKEEDTEEIKEKAQEVEAEKSTQGSLPEILPTPQKGAGLKSLKKTLGFVQLIPDDCDVSALPLRERREIQSQIERDAVENAIARWREENESLKKMGLNTSLSHSSLNSRLYEWQTGLEARLAEEMALIDEAESKSRKSAEDYDRCMYGPLMRLSSPSRLAALTIISLLSTSAVGGSGRGIPLASTIMNLTKNVEEDTRLQWENKKTKLAKSASKKRRVVLDKTAKIERGQAEARNQNNFPLVGDSAESASLAEAPWPVTARVKLGSVLLSALLDTAKIKVVREHPVTKTLVSQFQPAFSHAVQIKRGKKMGVLLLNKALVEVLSREPPGEYLAKHLPMLVEPEPWTGFDKGAFLESSVNVIRVKQGDKEQKLYAEAAIARGDMDQVFKGLDVLGKTAWRVNKPVLNVLLEAWNTGKAFAKIPPLDPEIMTPPEPASDEDPAARRKWIREVKLAENEKSAYHSQRCFMNFQLEVARAFRNQTFYFPHNVDFRGRAYPLPTYLNHMGADHVRGLLCFAKGKELGERGLQWLKVHLANVYGFDKASLSDRAAFAMDNLNNIFDSANKPLTGDMWWLKAEDPWQCLATCYELKAALESPDPTKFVSHLPIHQDGTCNGLQHYAALGGDTWGAQQVNLAPSDKPADVYTAVADIVKQSIAEDAAAGVALAKSLEGKITRKVVKQTVMTNVYGVTFSGAKKQICKQLDALYPKLPEETGLSNIGTASYIATLAFKALSSMFKGAHDIQNWLGQIGSRVTKAITAEQLERLAKDGVLESISQSTGRRVEFGLKASDILLMFRATIVWTTPLRMPVAQPYRKSPTRVIQTALQNLSLTVPERSDPVHSKKQLQAFPPNFVHSLDATHMLLSALECNSLGLDFAAVHDSFWTHAADVDSMNRVLRDAFIRIHSEDVIGRLAAEFEARYRGAIYMATVKPGPVATKILEWRKAENQSLRTELLLEYERQNLLRSSDPEEVAKGKAMVTPHSIFEEMSDFESLAETEELQGLGLGEISDKEINIEEDSVDEGDDVSANHVEPAPLWERQIERGEKFLKATTHNQECKISDFAARVVRNKSSTQQAANGPSIWMPLTLPEVPKKGDFKVEQLKQSEYFFS